MLNTKTFSKIIRSTSAQYSARGAFMNTTSRDDTQFATLRALLLGVNTIKILSK